jgi:hypothetical protein
MNPGKSIFFAGRVLAGFGLLIWMCDFGGRTFLPGDFVFRRPGLMVQFPIVTGLIASVVLSLALQLWNR